MKRKEIIELNGEEYTLELNRQSFIQIDKICNIQKIYEQLNENLYEYVEDIDDNYNPLQSSPTEEEIKKKVEEKVKLMDKVMERAFFIWMFPNHGFTISKVREILKPYFEDEEKHNFLEQKFEEYLSLCISIKEAPNDDDTKKA